MFHEELGKVAAWCAPSSLHYAVEQGCRWWQRETGTDDGIPDMRHHWTTPEDAARGRSSP